MLNHGGDKELHVLSNIFDTFWSIFASIFGRKPNQMVHDQKTPLRIVIFSTFLVGMVLFMSYRASLTSELSCVSPQKPFNSLQEFMESGIR